MSSDEVDGLPHALGIPILTRGHDSYENMLAASRQEPRSFWLQHERRYLLIHPYQEVLFEEAVSHATDEINQALKGFRDYKDRYGRGYAGLRWGRPLNLETWPTSIKRPNIEKYERFGSGSASRQEMIQALKKHGRFRLYITSPAQSQSRDVPFKAYKAILQHSVSSGHGPSTTEVVIHPLTRKERFYEWLAKTAKRIKLPAMIPFGQEEVTNVDTILSPVRGDESEREGELAQSLQAGESVAGHIHV
ncbi:hypothetical protein [Sporisorium scitamineum]|nr:hypothetical protein [Sporisorium scitamineum]